MAEQPESNSTMNPEIEPMVEETTASVSPALDILVDEHEEEVSENGKTVRRRGVYLLPNLFTTAALFAGFYAVIAAMRGDFEPAAIAIFAAGILDSLDGRIARLTNTQKQKLTLARAMVKNPDILVINEATSLFEKRVARQVTESILEHMKGRSVIWVVSNADLIDFYDRVIVLDRGKVLVAEHDADRVVVDA